MDTLDAGELATVIGGAVKVPRSLLAMITKSRVSSGGTGGAPAVTLPAWMIDAVKGTAGAGVPTR